ncbi:MAG TPA: hypothetical protein VJ783_02730, partial [Pirellulales bacterium]|nr:hypothetical protein [Pirellulales bacterium]
AFSYTIGNDSQTYGSPADLANDLGTTINTGVNGETLDITYTSSGDTVAANVGSYDITGTLADGSGSLSNYTVTLNNGTLTVDPYAFTYTIGNDSQTYGSPANLANDLGTTINTGVNGETLGITYASTGNTSTANAGSYDITGTLADGTGSLSNYTVMLNNGTLTVNPYAFTYAIGNDSQTYGSPANLANDLGTTIDTGINGETLGVTYASTGNTSTANVGSYDITGTLADGSGSLSNYTVTLNNGTLTVNPYAFTYTIGSDSQTYGSPADLANDLGTTINTGVNGETLGITYASTGNTSTANVGSYAITGTLADGSGLLSNYTVALNNGTLTVNPYALTYTIGNDLQVEGFPANLAADLPATISGVNGETLNIAYASVGDTASAAPGNYPITGILSNGSGLLSNYSVTLNPGTLTVAGPGATAIGDVLYLIGGNTNDHVDVSPVGPSSTGSSGIQVDASLNGVHIHDQVYSQSFKTIYVVGFGGNDHIDFAPSLTIPTVVREGDGNDQVWLGNGNNTVTVGNGNDDIRVGDGNNVIVASSGSDTIQAGNGDNLIVGGLGHSNISAGNGNNILIDGSVSQSADQLWSVLDEWMAGDVADVQSDLAAHVNYNTTKANSLQAGTGHDWFWKNYAKDRVNSKPGDLLN